MSEREAFDRILASLHETALDRAHWSTATALIDEALGVHGSSMAFGDGNSDEDIRIYFSWYFFRGQRHRDLEREYYEVYYPRDERVPRSRHLPDSQLFHTTDLLTEEELKTSATYNELLVRAHTRNGIHVRLDGPNDSRIVCRESTPSSRRRYLRSPRMRLTMVDGARDGLRQGGSSGCPGLWPGGDLALNA